MVRHPVRQLLPLLLFPILSTLLVAGEPSLRFEKTDWPWWRGQNRNGIADPDQDPPLTWSETENVLWKTPIPGRGHGAVSIVGDKIFINAADPEPQEQSLICLHRTSGNIQWRCVVHKGGFSEKGNRKASLASSTPACDGSQAYVTLLNAGAIYTSSISLDGRLLWQTKISDYVVHQGYGASPTVYENLLIVGADNKGGGAVAGLDRKTGQIVWKRDRPAKPNYASPVILNAAGKDQLIFTGCDLVTSLNPLTGEVYWETDGATTEVVTTSVTDGTRVFTSGGYPKNHISAVAADGSGKLIWENTVRTYVPSMVIRDGAIYTVQDAGIASCWDSATGAQLWKGRLGGTFSSSPVLVGNRMYATNEEGTTFILRASPNGFEKLAENKLGESVFSTPVICGGRIYTRVAHQVDGQRQEFLYCIGK